MMTGVEHLISTLKGLEVANGEDLCGGRWIREDDVIDAIAAYESEQPPAGPTQAVVRQPKFVITLTDEDFRKLSDRSQHLTETLRLFIGLDIEVLIQREGSEDDNVDALSRFTWLDDARFVPDSDGGHIEFAGKVFRVDQSV